MALKVFLQRNLAEIWCAFKKRSISGRRYSILCTLLNQNRMRAECTLYTVHCSRCDVEHKSNTLKYTHRGVCALDFQYRTIRKFDAYQM